MFLLFGILGCDSSEEEVPSAPSKANFSSAPEVFQPGDVVEPAPFSTAGEAPDDAGAAFSSVSGRVLAGGELGMVVSGEGVGDPSRSLDALEQQVLSFLPQLQEVYDREREQDPGLMGSLHVSLTIEPGGGVSDLRFPLTRISGEKLQAAVFDRMRAWTFSPATERVQLRYTLLFVPPEMDLTSILMWEQHLGHRAARDRSGEGRPDVVVAAAPTRTEKSPAQSSPSGETKRNPKQQVSPSPRPSATARVPKKKPPVPRVPPVARTPESSRGSVTGWYRVRRPAVLYTAPRESSDIVTQLRPGIRVRVVGITAGEWLEVRSVHNRPSGFLRLQDARPDPGARAELP